MSLNVSLVSFTYKLWWLFTVPRFDSQTLVVQVVGNVRVRIAWEWVQVLQESLLTEEKRFVSHPSPLHLQVNLTLIF